jgi:hypothetical protein
MALPPRVLGPYILLGVVLLTVAESETVEGLVETKETGIESECAKCISKRQLKQCCSLVIEPHEHLPSTAASQVGKAMLVPNCNNIMIVPYYMSL